MIDIVIFTLYILTIIGLGLWVSRTKKGHQTNANDYFLAGKTLPWWAIGASLIAANISAEQFIGMSGSGFAIGLAIASYEWMAALTLILVAKFLLPIFIEKGLYTIPQFIEQRFNGTLKTILAVFWIALFIFVNLTSVLYLGSKAIDTIVGIGDGSYVIPGIIFLGVLAASYSLYGGLAAVAWTDVVQVVLLVIGGLLTCFIALDALTPNGGVLAGFTHMMDVAGDKFHMILPKDHPQFSNLPGIGVLIGGMWVANVYYWGFNQYIIQRALAAKSLQEAQKGLLFAAGLKMILPILVVVPGIIAYVMFTAPEGTAVIDGVQGAFLNSDGSIQYDNSYPWLVKSFIPAGLKGLVIAALVAAIVSSLASMLNSVSTIFTMDIYQAYIRPDATDKQMLFTGRTTAAVALVVASVIAPLLAGQAQIFQYIQEYTGLVSPGILAVFLMGLFWKKTTAKAAVIGVIASIFIAFLLKLPAVALPFLDQMFYTAILTMVLMVGISLTTNPDDDDEKAIRLTSETFRTTKGFAIGSYVLMVVLALLYTVFW